MLDSGKSLNRKKRLIRLKGVLLIAVLSRDYPQEQLDDEIYVDIIDNEIVGFDLSELLGFKRSMGIKQVRLGSLTASNWCDMKV